MLSYISQKTGYGISCKLSPLETICMKCQILCFLGKIRKISPICHCWISPESSKSLTATFQRWHLRSALIEISLRIRPDFGACTIYRNMFLHRGSFNKQMIRLMTKPTKWHMRPAKTQINLGIRPVWSESSLCSQWIAKDPKLSSCG